MASLEELHKKAEERLKTKAESVRQAEIQSQEEIDKKFEKRKNIYDKLDFFKSKNEGELESVKKKRTSAIISFRSAADSLKKQFEDAKNNPDSIFSPFFKKDEDGNVVDKIDYKKVLDKEEGIDDFKKSKEDLETIKPKVRKLKARKEKVESVIVKNQKAKEDLYPKTSEYKKEVEVKEKQEKEKQEKDLSDKYIEKGNYVDSLSRDIEKDKYSNGNLAYSYKNMDALVSKDQNNIDDVKRLIDKKVEEGIALEEKSLELDKMKEGLDSISKFEKERNAVINDMREIQIEMKGFADQIYDVDGVSRYYGGKSNMNTDFLDYNFSSHFTGVDNFLINYKEGEKKIIDLDLIKKLIQDQRDYMSKFLELKDSNPEKITEYFKSDKKGQFYKEIFGKDKPTTYASDSVFYSKQVNFGNKISEKNTLGEIKKIYEDNTKKLNKKGEVIKGFAESSFDVSVKYFKIKKDYKKDPSSLEYDLKKDKEQENNLSNYLNWNIKDIGKENKNKLNENIVFSPTIMFESDRKEITDSEDSFNKAKESVANKEKEVEALKYKKLGLFDSKSKHEKAVEGLEDELKLLKHSLKNKKTDLTIKRKDVEENSNSRIIEKIFYDNKSIYSEFISKNINKSEPVSLGEILSKFNVIIEREIKEIESKKEENQKIERDLKEYQDLNNKVKEAKETLYSFYKEK